MAEAPRPPGHEEALPGEEGFDICGINHYIESSVRDAFQYTARGCFGQTARLLG
jgi:hypothetical protein